MKVWLMAELEEKDGEKNCCKCGVYQSIPKIMLAEAELNSRSNESSPKPTGRFMCLVCGKDNLV
jgi:hypothetical protein